MMRPMQPLPNSMEKVVSFEERLCLPAFMQQNFSTRVKGVRVSLKMMSLPKNYAPSDISDLIPVGFGCYWTNAKMTELNAAVGLCGLDSIDEILSKREMLAGEYRSGISYIEGIESLEFEDGRFTIK